MEEYKKGLVVASVGGIFEVLCEFGEHLSCPARGTLRRGEGRVLVGDRVHVLQDEKGESVIAEILPRKNSLIRPPLANLDRLFAVLATRDPEPITETTDKLLAIAEHNDIDVTVIITKTDLGDERADSLAVLYRMAGYTVFTVSSETGEGIDAVKAHLGESLAGGKIAAFAGASGVGKSSLLNACLPGLSLLTGEISQKIGRGKNTTRETTLHPAMGGYLADTPGFSMLDFIRFDFMKWTDLPYAFREFAPYLGQCRYADCNHVKEEECAIRQAVGEGKIAPSRYESYTALYTVLRNKNPYGEK